MKKLLALLLAFSMIFLFVACQSAEEEIEEYIEAQEDDLKALSDTYKAQGIEFECFAEDSTIVFKCTFTVDVGDVATIKPLLEAQESTLKSSLGDQFDELQDECSAIEELSCRYYTKDGELIYKLDID